MGKKSRKFNNKKLNVYVNMIFNVNICVSVSVSIRSQIKLFLLPLLAGPGWSLWSVISNSSPVIGPLYTMLTVIYSLGHPYTRSLYEA